ncbi:hypothetical protein EJ02DRAFT_458048 [Clathrospora elynae]|uniref:Uncharacterized protein n=1 Tax=Clathrospora elynae TaxID=706981 RepID=A0A6A5SF68_9PLEO|nr:hypothetical protein EJ02DRAFT_458048 [Clathrospora elynae]
MDPHWSTMAAGGFGMPTPFHSFRSKSTTKQSKSTPTNTHNSDPSEAKQHLCISEPVLIHSSLSYTAPSTDDVLTTTPHPSTHSLRISHISRTPSPSFPPFLYPGRRRSSPTHSISSSLILPGTDISEPEYLRRTNQARANLHPVHIAPPPDIDPLLDPYGWLAWDKQVQREREKIERPGGGRVRGGEKGGTKRRAKFGWIRRPRSLDDRLARGEDGRRGEDWHENFLREKKEEGEKRLEEERKVRKEEDRRKVRDGTWADGSMFGGMAAACFF